MNTNNLRNICNEIKKINIRLIELENRNPEAVDIDSLNRTNTILINSEINIIKDRISKIEININKMMNHMRLNK